MHALLIGRVDVGQPEAVGVMGMQCPSRYVREARDARREKPFDVFRIGPARRIAKTYLRPRTERHEAFEHRYRRSNLHPALIWAIEGRSEIETHGNFGRNSFQKPRVFVNRIAPALSARSRGCAIPKPTEQIPEFSRLR